MSSDGIKFMIEEETELKPILDLENDGLGKEPQFDDISEQIRCDDEETFYILIGAAKYKKEEIEIRVSKDIVVVIGRPLERKDAWRKLNKKITIPLGVKHENIIGVLSKTGILTLTFPTKIPQAFGISGPQQQPKSQSGIQVNPFGLLCSGPLREGSGAQNTNPSGNAEVKPRKVDFDEWARKGYTYEQITEEEYIIKDGKIFEKEVEIGEFSPEDIEVSQSNDGRSDWVIIEGKRRFIEGTKCKFRSFYKMFSLPPKVKPETISYIYKSGGGILTVTAPIN